MGEKTAIEWADRTLNTAWGCTKVSAGCENCYMFRLSKIFGRNPEDPKPRKEANIKKDLKKYKDEPSVIFFNSMSDTYHESFSDELIKSWFDIIKDEPHEFIILTKRVNRAYNFHKSFSVPQNCWIGTSIENGSSLHRLDKLKMIDAKIRFVSFEPLLGDIQNVNLEGIHWAIVGGESDFANPRPFKEQWGLHILEACRKYGTAFFYKQSGGKRKINGCWGTNTLNGKKYLEMPIKLTTKESQDILTNNNIGLHIQKTL